MGGIRPDEGVEEGVNSEKIRFETVAFHFLEELVGEVRAVGVDVGGEGGVEEGFGDSGVGAEEEGVEGVAAIGGDEGGEEGLGVGEFAAGEERVEEGEEGVRGGAEWRRGVGLEPIEEREEGSGI